MAMDSQPFRGHIPNGVPPNRTYQEVYAENGRWYGTFKKGKYMFPIDESSWSRAEMRVIVLPSTTRKLLVYWTWVAGQVSGASTWPIIGPRVYAEIYRHLKPYYGYFEQVEIDWSPRSDDGSLRRDGYVVQWANELMDAMDSFGRPIRLDSNLTKQRLADVGFDEIKEEVIQLPLNGWPTEVHNRELGRWFNLGVRQAFQPLSLAPLCRGHGRTPAQVDELAEKARGEVYSNSVRAYCTFPSFAEPAGYAQVTPKSTIPAPFQRAWVGSREPQSGTCSVQRENGANGDRSTLSATGTFHVIRRIRAAQTPAAVGKRQDAG
ncbi:hypothetical protein CHGG_01690 [Chaetomium globosum CBS 148.51]|uniref:Protein-methionine methyltransferase laeA n=1 Tax=Chaetomium globosum (strain ATCC 6205 / CBS 148.51 / DSM 1962 / NBRC 6347 / NRRL 1970) TaxID=306901 RepID=LAEA_CHAGB|nr:uncharacterized protein CHGG_01690 [Chaetomium globosum CBS 148.51]Q2HDL4.1 RecName: Full=Protein-methionine methyltransferase laeA; AltName: Full=Secondary metabolism regulator laeA; AltName: Full=Velvet complex subunit laeA [Chaetomium globosum CBS 148.51]EAQ93455.1 hypothetical protein CHGG_01690 [Chaetomium globosum CBS 148.51]